ncbi:MAG: tRNA-binding protein [Candidatus Micrarchaeales archaeon]|jgi:tRNA-binding protein|uniref:Export-related chaperone CsaA n=1 Tax=Candidatus Micrarchaeum acidiphilum ARMAN-2 TaxID=425595 RepID=C7DHD4_MICA2|nr:MAG: export-related chaperone CsaA [Candidatus Micrarchaeum acidiphilum ARMAN-2]MCW6160604.1 tRNA-binding protein [Candidatus Micrarchaeales archaeon]
MDGYAEYDNFSRLDIRVGEIKSVEVFSEAKKPAYKLYIFFGDEIGIKKSSAQIRNYSVDELVGRKVIAVVNFKPKQVANFVSEVLVLGAITDEGVKLLGVDDPGGVKPGCRIG